MVWSEVDEKSKERGKEWCALLMSLWICQSIIEAHGSKRSRIVWAIGKVRILKYALCCDMCRTM